MRKPKPTLATVTYSTASDEAVVSVDVTGASLTGDDRLLAESEERALAYGLRAVARALRLFRDTMNEARDA